MGRSLPYIQFWENADEVDMYQVANTLRGAVSPNARNVIMQGYPPAYLTIMAIGLSAMDTLFQTQINRSMPIYIFFFRFLSIMVDLLSLAVLLHLARKFGGDLAMLCAGLTWVLSATLAYQATGALGDPFVVLLCATTCLFSVYGLERGRVELILLATLTGALAGLFKYYAITILCLPGLMLLLLLPRKPKAVVITGLLSALIVAGATLIILSGSSSMTSVEATQAKTTLVSNMINGERWGKVISGIMIALSPSLFILFGVGLLYLLWRRKLSTGLLIAGLALISQIALVPGFIRPLILPLWTTRYSLPAIFFIVLIGSVASALLVENVRWVSGKRRLVGYVVVLCCLLPYQLIWASTSYLPDGRTAFQSWSQSNLPDGATLWTPSETLMRVLSRYEGGYTGKPNFTIQISPQPGTQSYWLLYENAAYSAYQDALIARNATPLVTFAGNNLQAAITVYQVR